MKPDSSGKVRVADKIKGLHAEGKIDFQGCAHFSEIKDFVPSSVGCEKCVQLGDTWVNLRLCLTCGHVGCCDNSKNTHATKHYHETLHAVIVSFEQGEEWLWCYADEVSI
jgi:uncharacterized UBP type Zn finger protein